MTSSVETPEAVVGQGVSPPNVAEPVHEALKIGLAGQKGGIGKSTVIRAIASEGVGAGYSTKIADLDIKQQTCIAWQKRRMAAGHRPPIPVEAFHKLGDALAIAPQYDLLLIDTKGESSVEDLELAKAVDLLLLPTGVGLDDLEPTIKLFYELEQAGISKDKMAILFTRIGSKAELIDANDYCDAAGAPYLPGGIFEKTAYRKGMNKGKSVAEVNIKSLKDSADALIQSIIDRVPN